ncbi:MAG TPA: LLM class F420-dependent oxidoreductase, partial [Pseudolysinimonas sp.]|nr:LLM class F420-dependent oxidoreductase [Pseudolysinimonas sp.]
PKADIRSPHEIEQMARMVRPEHLEGRLHISADPDNHRAYLQGFLDLGVDRIYLHNVGRNQREFLDVFGRDVLPGLNP